MKFSEVELPSNKKFGFFFTFIFAIVATYCFYFANMIWAYISTGTSLILFVCTVVRADILLPLNKLWMRFGFLLGIIVSPIVLGIIFFGIFTPIAIFMRLIGRDELQLKFTNKASHWISRSEPIRHNAFKQQF